jgi:hypothetical protein
MRAAVSKQPRFLLLAALVALWLTASPAFAACTNPNGNAGDAFFSSTSSVLVYCNGTNWIAMGQNTAVSFGTLTPNYFCTATSGAAIQCNTNYTGSNNVVLSASPTLTGTVAGASSTWTGQVAIGTTTTSGALNVNGTVTATLFSGSGASLTNATVPVAAINASGTPSATTFLAGNGTWETVGSGGGVTGSGFTTGDFCTASGPTGIVCSTAQVSLTTQVTGVLPIANGGTNTNTQTTNGVLYYNGTAITSGSAFTFNGTNVGVGTATATQPLTVFGNVDIGQTANYSGLLTEIPNSGTTGTTQYKLAKLTSANAVVIGTTGDTDGMIGIVVGETSGGTSGVTTGNAQIAIHGQALCTFDAAPTGVGDFVTISSATAGDCHDSGTKTRSSLSSQTIGQVLSTTAVSGNYPVAVNMNGSGGGVPAGTTGQVQYNSGSSSFAATSNLTFLSANNQLVVGTGAATPAAVGTSGTVAGFALNMIPQNIPVIPANGTGGLTFSTAATGQMAYYSGPSTISGTPDLYVASANIGLGTSTPTNLLSLAGQNPEIIWMERAYAPSTTGSSLTLQAGGAASGGSNLNGGNLVLSGGISTGTGTSQIQLQTFPGVAAAANDNTIQTRMTILGNGNVGIGTTGPNSKLSISGGDVQVDTGHSLLFGGSTTLAADAYAYDSSGAVVFSTNTFTLNTNKTAGTNYGSAAITVNTSGYVGIGTTGPAYPLDISGSVARISGANSADWSMLPTGTGGREYRVGSSDNTNGMGGGLFFVYDQTANAARLVINSSGNVGIGTTNPGDTLHVWGSAPPLMLTNKSYGTAWQVGPDLNNNFVIYNQSGIGVYVGNGGTSWNANSDVRLKKNIATYSVLDKLADYRAVSFDWKSSDRHEVGVIAQELYRVFPEIVIKGDDDLTKPVTMGGKGAWGVSYDRLGALSMEGVKELKSLFDADHDAIAELKADNDTLRAANDNEAAEIKALTARLDKLEAVRH